MFNLNNFQAMLSKYGYTKKKLAEELGISYLALYRRISNGGNFSVEEVRKLITIFGKEDVYNSLFY